MRTQKKSGHSIDMRTLVIRIVALLCALAIIGGAFLVAFA